MRVMKTLCFVSNMSDQEKSSAFTHEWSNYPPSLFEPCTESSYGYVMRKGVKSDFMQSVLSDIKYEPIALQNFEEELVFLVDGMAFIQKFRTMRAKTFFELQKEYLRQLIKMKPSSCTSIHFIGDRYDTCNSFKLDERNRRTLKKTISYEFTITDTIPIPNWNNFINNSKNKANFLQYISKCWCQQGHMLPNNLNLYLGGTFADPCKCVKVSNNECSVVSNLKCNHEEADTRIMTHLKFVVEELHIERAVIEATDTDIILLSMFNFFNIENLKELWVHNNKEYLAIHDVNKKLENKYKEKNIIKTLLVTYVLSGCDTISYPFRRGKKKAATVALKQAGQLNNLANFGDNCDTIDDSVIEDGRRFFVNLYGRNDFKCLNLLRQHLFSVNQGDLRSLPPTEDAFLLHLKRALYQALVLKRSTEPRPCLPSPKIFGYVVDNGQIKPQMMTKKPLPDLKKIKKCTCKVKCDKKCTCSWCSVACTCAAFPNNCFKGKNTELSDSDSD